MARVNASKLTCLAFDDSAAPPTPNDHAGPMDFARVVRDHGRALYARALWLTKHHAHASDLFQGTIERAIRAGKNIPADRELRWLMTIMHNAFLDDRRAELSRRCAGNSAEILEQLPRDEVESDDETWWRRIDDGLLAGCVRELPVAMRRIFELQVAGASYRELARRLEISTNTVGTRILRMRRRLRAALLAAIKEGATSVVTSSTGSASVADPARATQGPPARSVADPVRRARRYCAQKPNVPA